MSITSKELLKRAGLEMGTPFEVGPFPPEMRLIEPVSPPDWSELMDAPFQNPDPKPAPPRLEEGRRIECAHCNGVGWYETGNKLESGNNWDEPYTWEWEEAECEACGGTGWAP